jgi:hypothetical protein
MVVDVSQRDINAVSAFQYFSTRKVSGPFFISIARKSRFMSLTVTGFVRFIAIFYGNAELFYRQTGVAVITERAL